jgi:energy-coupling factor transport system substrate-specific component
VDLSDDRSSSCDETAALLRVLRADAGDPSYGELVKRVMRQRMSRGMSEWEARVGRTTVYDTFRPGRRVLDLDLVTELVRALDGSEDDLARCIAGHNESRPTSPAESQEGQPRLAIEIPSDASTEHERRTPAAAATRSTLTPGLRATVLIGCIALNLTGRVLVNTTHIPLYLDMVGTAAAAIILGPWSGASVGAATSLLGVVTNGWVSAPFAGVEIAGALVWGYGISQFGLGRSVPRFFLLNVLAAVCCSIVAVPIIVWGDHGHTGSGADQITVTMHLFWHDVFASVATQNLLTSLADKLISGFAALAVAEMVAAHFAPQRQPMVLRSVGHQLSHATRGALAGRSSPRACPRPPRRYPPRVAYRH